MTIIACSTARVKVGVVLRCGARWHNARAWSWNCARTR